MRTRIFVNLQCAEKVYSKKGEAMCPNDGYVVFRNSELLAGQLGKTILGGGNKGGLFAVLNSGAHGSTVFRGLAVYTWLQIGSLFA